MLEKAAVSALAVFPLAEDVEGVSRRECDQRCVILREHRLDLGDRSGSSASVGMTNTISQRSTTDTRYMVLRSSAGRFSGGVGTVPPAAAGGGATPPLNVMSGVTRYSTNIADFGRWMSTRACLKSGV